VPCRNSPACGGAECQAWHTDSWTNRFRFTTAFPAMAFSAPTWQFRPPAGMPLSSIGRRHHPASSSTRPESSLLTTEGESKGSGSNKSLLLPGDEEVVDLADWDAGSDVGRGAGGQAG
jgi:hypothetical protein